MLKERRYLPLLLILIIVMALAACRTDEATPADDGGDTNAGETTEADDTAAEEEMEASETLASASELDIVYIPKNEGNPYFDSIIGGFEEACGDLGCNFTTVAPATAEATSQVPFIQEQIQRGVDVIAIAPNSPDALNDLFDEARAAGILVMIVNSDIPGSESHRDVAILPTDFDALGASQVELMGSLIDYEGKIAILSATADAPDQNYWIEGMQAALEEDKYAGMELVEIVYGDDDPQKSLTECEALISRYPDLRGIISPTTVGVAASAQCVESAGVFPEGPNVEGMGLEVTGLGTPNQMRRFVEDGIVEEFALWDPAIQGVIATYLANAILVEGNTLEDGFTFDAGRVGSIVIGDNGVIVAGPPLVFNMANIDDFDF